MKEITVCLNSIDKVKDFVNKTTFCPCDLDLISSNCRYIIDAKSIMGVFSLDLSKNLTLKIHSENADEIASIEEKLKDFIV